MEPAYFRKESINSVKSRSSLAAAGIRRRRTYRHAPRFALHLAAPLALGMLVAACSSPRVPSLESLPGPSDLPFIYKIDVQQGNVVTQEMLAQLQRGMDKKKVNFVMGTPIIQDTFNADRWDYIYTFKEGGSSTVERRRVTLVFLDEKLDHVEGDVTPAVGRLIMDTRQDTTVEVPLFKRKSFVAKIRDKIPFTDPVEPEYEYDVPGFDKNAGAEDEDGEDGSDSTVADEGDADAADEKTVLVPRDAPTNKKKKGFFARIADGLGIGAEEDEPQLGGEYDPGDPKYRDITNPEDL